MISSNSENRISPIIMLPTAPIPTHTAYPRLLGRLFSCLH
jgi:hypothetical protein